MLILLAAITSQANTASNTGPGEAITGCSPCMLLAPIDQVILGNEASYSVRLGIFTVLPGGPVRGPSLVALQTATVITYNNIPITSPTIYNVFSSFQNITETINADGECISSEGANIMFPTPIPVQLPTDTPSNTITQAEEFFFSQIGGVSCLAGGVFTIPSIVVLPVPTIKTTVAGATFTLTFI